MALQAANSSLEVPLNAKDGHSEIVLNIPEPGGNSITSAPTQQAGNPSTSKDSKGAIVDPVLKALSDARANFEKLRKSNTDREVAKADLRKVRQEIDRVLEPTLFEWLQIHKTLIITIFLTAVGIAGSVLGLVQGSVSEKNRTAFVLTGAILSLVGNTISSATGVYVPVPGAKKAKDVLESSTTVDQKTPHGEVAVNETLVAQVEPQR